MDRPLWRIVIPLLIVGFAVQRGALAAMAVLSEAPLGIAVGAALQVAALLALALAIFLGRSWALAAAVGFGLAIVATAALQAAAFGPAFFPRALAQLIVALVVVAGVGWLVRHEFPPASGSR